MLGRQRTARWPARQPATRRTHRPAAEAWEAERAAREARASPAPGRRAAAHLPVRPRRSAAPLAAPAQRAARAAARAQRAARAAARARRSAPRLAARARKSAPRLLARARSLAARQAAQARRSTTRFHGSDRSQSGTTRTTAANREPARKAKDPSDRAWPAEHSAAVATQTNRASQPLPAREGSIRRLRPAAPKGSQRPDPIDRSTG